MCIRDRSYLALGGVSGKALDRFLSERKDTRKVFLCLDSDTAGSEACTRLAQSIPGEIAVIRLESGQVAIEIYDNDSPMTVKIKESMALYLRHLLVL